MVALTEIGKDSGHQLSRPEYPRPILRREAWLSLNGIWDFAADPDNRGLSERWYERFESTEEIRVPFAPGTDASGVAQSSACVVWYHRVFSVPEAWIAGRVCLHIGAADYATRVFVNGLEVGQHSGGYAPFSFDIAHALKAGDNHVNIRVEDSASWSQPRGKQEGTTRWPIDYDAVIGIWQTVWLEPLPRVAIRDIHSSFQLDSNCVRVNVSLNELFTGALELELSFNGRRIVHTQTQVELRGEIKSRLQLDNPRDELPLWSPDNPRLCDLSLRLLGPSGDVLDEVQSYTGLREIAAGEAGLKLNGEPLYLRGVLDQGYFPQGWYSAGRDEDYVRDIELTKAMGFNCARKHQKAEDPRYLYWADRLGLLIWAEMPSGRIFSSDLVESLTAQWMQLVRRDRSHPCIVAWVPFNESWGVWNQSDRSEQRALVDALANLTKALDASRLVIGNDGWEYSSGDVWTLHLYEGESQPLAERLASVLEEPTAQLQEGGRVGALDGACVDGLPVLLTECGGIGFSGSEDSSAGNSEALFAYGDLPRNIDELEGRIRSVADDVHSATALCGFVWTQLTDVQQEVNGLLTFDREPKLPLALYLSIFSRIGSDAT